MTATPARTTGCARKDGTASCVTALGLASGIVPVKEVRPPSSNFSLSCECVFSVTVMIVKSYWGCQKTY